jgi:hypothetical protein
MTLSLIWHAIVKGCAVVAEWLKTYESLAIWLEGIALVSLFVLEFKQFKDAHKETLEQIDIAKQQAEAARLTAQSVVNSGRAWLMTWLRWRQIGHIVSLDSQVGDTQVKMVCIEFLLTITNDGKTPAWIETITSSMEISGKEKQPERAITDYISPIGAGKEREVLLRLCCPGELQSVDELAVHIKVHYRDIFEARLMELEFFVNPQNFQIRRVEKATVDFRSSTPTPN